MYPGVMILMLFWILKIDTSLENLAWFFAYGILSNFIFCGQGFFLGIMVLDESSVKIVNVLFVMVFISANGVLCNLTTANWFIKFMSHISPCRFNTEGFVRRTTMQIPDLTHHEPIAIPQISQEQVLENFGYTYGDNLCISVLVIWFFVWIILSIIAINVKFRKL